MRLMVVCRSEGTTSSTFVHIGSPNPTVNICTYDIGVMSSQQHMNIKN
jgi:hypothetical protein